MADETPTPVAVMREAYDAEVSLWMIRGEASTAGHCFIVERDGKKKFTAWGYDTAEKWARLRMREAGHRAALRALAGQFNDPVVKNALLWAAKEGEKP